MTLKQKAVLHVLLGLLLGNRGLGLVFTRKSAHDNRKYRADIRYAQCICRRAGGEGSYSGRTGQRRSCLSVCHGAVR